MLRVWRRRLAGLIAPPDDWGSLPPAPKPPIEPTDLGRLPTRGDFWALLRHSPATPWALAWRLLTERFNGDPLARAEAYLPRSGQVVHIGPADPLVAPLLRATAPNRPFLSLRRPALAPTNASCRGILAVHQLNGAESSAAGAAIIERCFAALRPGGLLVALEFDTRPRAGQFWLMLGWLARRSWAISPPTVRPSRFWVDQAEAAGFRAQVTPPVRQGLLPWTLIIAHKPGDPALTIVPNQPPMRRPQ